MKKALASIGLLVLSFIPAPSFSHGNEKYSACELSRIVNGTYGGKAENAIFYCWDPNDPDAGIGIPGIPDMEPMEMPSFESESPADMSPADMSPADMSPADMSPAGRTCTPGTPQFCDF